MTRNQRAWIALLQSTAVASFLGGSNQANAFWISSPKNSFSRGKQSLSAFGEENKISPKTLSSDTNQQSFGIPLTYSSTALFSDISPGVGEGYFGPLDVDDTDSDTPLLAVDPKTELIVGLNKYSHDTSICAADAKTGQVLFYLSQERLSRKKHSAGSTSTIMQTCLEQLNLDLDSVKKVVVNNHHHRVLPVEEDRERLKWQAGLGINDRDGGLEGDYNLVPEAEKHEISHHLAHAYSAAAQSPFSNGLVVVMDGMGETFGAMNHALHHKDETYTCDLQFEGKFKNVPSDIRERASTSPFDWREGESAYKFQKDESGKINVEPVFKRWIEEKSPPALYNHGFENMESVGAVYSRASSHIFGNWNACGKVMGLAPWQDKWGKPDSITRTMSGKLYVEEGEDAFSVNRDAIVGRPLHGQTKYEFDESEKPTDLARDAITLAASVQNDLEEVTLDFVAWLKEQTGETNLCIAGGVGLNSVLNGKLSRDLGFEQVFIPPYPGDDGIAVGCCAFGLFGNPQSNYKPLAHSPPQWKKPLSPYLGPAYDEFDIDDALDQASPWLEVEQVSSEQRRLEMVAREIADGGVVAWYHGRSEAGPRALGHRSLLADPRKPGLIRFINNSVKGRESFRPFAPSCLAEESQNWFDGLLGSNSSPFMSITALVKPEKRDLIPAVTHVDGSSRLQTVEKEAEPLYHRLISTFFQQTGIPMVLNTSFNTLKGEPIVESPKEAVRSFLCSMGSVEMLVIGDNIVRRKKMTAASLLGDKEKNGSVSPPSNPMTAGPFIFESTCSYTGDPDQEPKMHVRVRMPDRPMHDDSKDGGWFLLKDEFEAELLGRFDGTVGVMELLEYYHPDDARKGFDQSLLENIMQRITRLYEHTLIGW